LWRFISSDQTQQTFRDGVYRGMVESKSLGQFLVEQIFKPRAQVDRPE
jgi:hypothetical protein